MSLHIIPDELDEIRFLCGPNHLLIHSLCIQNPVQLLQLMAQVQ